MRMNWVVVFLLYITTAANASTVDTIRVFSKAMKRDVKSVVILPTQTPVVKAFPVLYLLHGFGGNFALWLTKVPQLKDLADKYGCIIVCPDAGFTTLYFDNPLDSNSQFETHFIEELMPYVEAHYATQNDRRFRAISGLSMGGFGAFFLASRHTELFSAAGSMSGVLDLKPFSKNMLAGRKIADSTCCSVNWDSLQTGKLRLAFECGLDDYLLPVNRHVHKRLTELKVAHDYTERPGRHEWSYWKNAIEYQLLFFKKNWEE